MTYRRSTGLLLHPTSLPGSGGIGTLGPEAHRFLDVLADAGCRLWQLLPLGPTGFGDSPYQSFSAFAGNPLLIYLGANEDKEADTTRVDFAKAIARQRVGLAAAIEQFVPDEHFRRFREESAAWLADYASFMALKDAHGGTAWTSWGTDARRRHLKAERATTDLRAAIYHREVEQYLFHVQFQSLRAAAARRGIQLMGDVPIYVAHDSADVWAHPGLFQLNADGTPRVQAGVPPDYFSSTGQLWGNPLYDWAHAARTGYAWWIQRVRHALTRFDVVRLDHFRGFEAYWEVAGDARTAIDGRWVKGPGLPFFTALENAVGPGRIVAEDLGEITPEVEALREAAGLPGMGVLQFAFGDGDAKNVHLPHNWRRPMVAYTGTHDNDTAVGWWTSLPSSPLPAPPGQQDLPEGDEVPAGPSEPRHDQRAHAAAYLDLANAPVHRAMIRAVLASVADTAILPLQDLLGLGSESRMNHPGRSEGNWTWRFTWDQLAADDIRWLRTMIELFGRLPAAEDEPGR